mgnify:CR=1 FL=1
MTTDSGMTRPEVTRVVNRWIGVSGGYLGDFSYRSHADFYPEYCDLEIDPYQIEGTTRERFMEILSGASPSDQAKILKGVLERFPLDDAGKPSTRTSELKAQLEKLIVRLESGPAVQSAVTHVTSAVVVRALNDAEALIKSSGATSGVDRIHTALHGYLEAVCDEVGIGYPERASITQLFKILRAGHPKLAQLGPRDKDVERVLFSCASIFDAMNTLRNQASVAHPNSKLLDEPEAMLVINTGRTLLNYLSAKLDEERGAI